jgi:hypothetical protein
MSSYDGKRRGGLDSGSSWNHADPRRQVSPGKTTLTMSLPPRAGGPRSPQPVQHRPVEHELDPASEAARPDLNPAPVQRVAAAEIAGRELPSDGTGQPMPAEVQAKMNAAFGRDLSAVRIHEGPRAAALGARAFTQGMEVHFAPGQYQPESQAGQELLGHELAHVVQQSQGRVQATTQAKGMDINADHGLEAEADAMGAAAARGEPAAARGGAVTGSSGRAPIQAVWDPSSRFGDLWTLQWHRVEGALQWFYNTNNDKYLYIVDGDISSNPRSEAIHDNSYVEQTWAEWQSFAVQPPRKYREQDDRSFSPEVRYEYVKRDPGFVAPDPQANPKEISKALDVGISQDAEEIFDALAQRVETTAQERVSLADKDVYKRIKPVFTQLKSSLNQGKVEPTPDLHGKVNETLLPLKYRLSQVNQLQAATAARTLKSASEALSELQYAAIILASKTVKGGFVLGAQGPVWSPQQVEAPSPEAKHGGLPPLDVLRLEVDAYYQTTDGVLHADEVKDTPRAMAEKIKKGDQIGRQVEWLKTPAIRSTGARFEKQVGYYVQAQGPGFDNLLDQAVIGNLSLIEQNQEPGRKFLLLSAERFSLTELEDLMNEALKWLTDSRPALQKKNIKLGTAAQRYFGDLATARQSLQTGPLTVED